MEKEELIKVLEDRIEELKNNYENPLERDWKKIDLLKDILSALKD